MATLTIEIPNEVLKQNGSRKLLVVDPKEFEKELRMRWEHDDALKASQIGKHEYKIGKAKVLNDLADLMK